MIRSKLKQPKRSPEDVLFSEYIRKRAIMRVGGCERCGAQKYDIEKDKGEILPAWKLLHCAHLISRVHHGTRWDPDNALGLCPGCHFFIDREPKVKELFIIEKIGLYAYQQLLIRKAGVHRIDHAALMLYLKKQIEELKYQSPWRE